MVAALIAVPKVAFDSLARKVVKWHVEQMPDVVVGTLKNILIIWKNAHTLTYCSKLTFEAWVNGANADAYWLSNVLWYSCKDDGGDWSLAIAQESKKFAFVDHNVSNLLNFPFWSSLASTIFSNIKIYIYYKFCFTYWSLHRRTWE